MKQNGKFVLNSKQEILFEFIKKSHGDQKRKYTGEPYWTHLLSVAEISSEYEHSPFTVEIALCHDYFEDVKGERIELMNHLKENLKRAGYLNKWIDNIVIGALWLTDAYTKESYPDMNRVERKRLEVMRLSEIPQQTQSIKYADLIDNTSSIIKHDKKFAVVYLQEKQEILNAMRGGNIDLFIKCCHSLYEAKRTLDLVEKSSKGYICDTCKQIIKFKSDPAYNKVKPGLLQFCSIVCQDNYQS